MGLRGGQNRGWVRAESVNIVRVRVRVRFASLSAQSEFLRWID